MIAARQFTLQRNLLENAQGRAHAGDALAEFHGALLDELAETGPEQPRGQMPHVPAIEGDLVHKVALEHLTQMMGDELPRDGLARGRL